MSNTTKTRHSGSNAGINIPYLFYLGLTAALGGLLFGFDVAIIAGAGPFLTQHFRLSEISMGIAFSSLLFGCALGALVAGLVADRLGRRLPLLWVAALFAVTSIGTGVAPDFHALLLFRFLGGIAVGGASILVPMYVAEISPPLYRGRMCACYQWAITTGILVSFLLNYLLRNAGNWDWFNSHVCDLGPWNWRWMFITGVAPSIVFYLMLSWAPETPRYLFRSGHEQRALDLLRKILGEAEAARELLEIRASMTAVKVTRRDWAKPQLRKPLTIGFILAILVHFSGVNTVVDYAPVIFRSAGFKMDAALFATFGVGLCFFLFTIVSLGIIDRYGRKPLYVVGSLGMCLVQALLALAVYTGRFEGNLVLVLILSYIALFAACIGPVFWTLVPEIFPNKVRGEAMIVPVVVQWVANAVVVLLFPLAFHKLGKGPTFLFLGIMALAQALFTWRFVPETKGRTLEEIEALWSSNGTDIAVPIIRSIKDDIT
jgi:SP family arabinose:H+ symporter-like MFS transporter